jgi:hypothetical protein
MMDPKHYYLSILVRCMLDEKFAILVGLVFLIVLISGSG